MMDQFYSREFIEIIQSNFNSQEHQFIIMKKKNKKMYINPEKYQNVSITSVSRERNVLEFIVTHIKFFALEYIRLRKLMKQVDYIFIHNLTEEISGILFRFKGKAKILWVMWGVDLYNYIPLKLFDQCTSELLIKLDSKVKSILLRLYFSFFHWIRKSVIKRVYIINSNKMDFRLLKKYFNTKAKWFSNGIYPNPINFEKLDKEIDFIDEKFKLKKNGEKLILLGNSGVPTNNHLDAMIRLSKMKDHNFKIICPLSYGPPIYIKKIIYEGKMIFGDRFIPLLEFLKPKIYFQILKQIDLAVMYHNRQQGGGSAHILIYLGKPICMKKTSGYFDLIEKGAIVFSIQDLEKLILNEVEFTQTMVENNKKMATQELSTLKSAISSVEMLLNILDNRKDISDLQGNVDNKFKGN